MSSTFIAAVKSNIETKYGAGYTVKFRGISESPAEAAAANVSIAAGVAEFVVIESVSGNVVASQAVKFYRDKADNSYLVVNDTSDKIADMAKTFVKNQSTATKKYDVLSVQVDVEHKRATCTVREIDFSANTSTQKQYLVAKNDANQTKMIPIA
jgi:hypothetical protein